MEFILTVIFYFADAPSKVRREQVGSFIECEQARLEAVSNPPRGVQSVTATCVSGHLSEAWKTK